MIRPPGIDNGAFVVKPETGWYARVSLLFSDSVSTGTGSKAFDCAHVSTLETYDDPMNGYIAIIYIITLKRIIFQFIIEAIMLFMLINCVSQDG